eukprot:g13348.t1
MKRGDLGGMIEPCPEPRGLLLRGRSGLGLGFLFLLLHWSDAVAPVAGSPTSPSVVSEDTLGEDTLALAKTVAQNAAEEAANEVLNREVTRVLNQKVRQAEREGRKIGKLELDQLAKEAANKAAREDLAVDAAKAAAKRATEAFLKQQLSGKGGVNKEDLQAVFDLDLGNVDSSEDPDRTQRPVSSDDVEQKRRERKERRERWPTTSTAASASATAATLDDELYLQEVEDNLSERMDQDERGFDDGETERTSSSEISASEKKTIDELRTRIFAVNAKSLNPRFFLPAYGCREPYYRTLVSMSTLLALTENRTSALTENRTSGTRPLEAWVRGIDPSAGDHVALNLPRGSRSVSGALRGLLKNAARGTTSEMAFFGDESEPEAMQRQKNTLRAKAEMIRRRQNSMERNSEKIDGSLKKRIQDMKTLRMLLEDAVNLEVWGRDLQQWAEGLEVEAVADVVDNLPKPFLRGPLTLTQNVKRFLLRYARSSRCVVVKMKNHQEMNEIEKNTTSSLIVELRAHAEGFLPFGHETDWQGWPLCARLFQRVVIAGGNRLLALSKEKVEILKLMAKVLPFEVTP